MSQTETKLELLPCPFCGGEATNKPLQPIVCGCGTWNVTRKQWNNRTNSKDKETIRELQESIRSARGWIATAVKDGDNDKLTIAISRLDAALAKSQQEGEGA